MKKFRLAAAVSIAALSMSAQAMAAPLTVNTASESDCPITANATSNNLNSIKNLDSVLQNSLKSVDIDSIISQLGCADGQVITNLESLNALKGTKDTNCPADTDCTGADCQIGTDCTGADCQTGTDCTGSDCTTDTSNNGSSNNGSSNNGSSNNGSSNNGSSDNGSSDNTTVSANAQAVVDLVNAERAKAGLGALEIDPNVTKAAQVRAKEIQTSFSHTRPDGRTPFTSLDEAGASYKGAGENIALGQKTPEQVMNDWMNSPGHKANILNSKYKYIGVGVDGNAWTQLFTY